MTTSSSDHGPSYYRRGGIQVWDFIRDQGLNFHLGNAIKYICRAGYKTDSKVEDLKKAIHYLQNELESVQLDESPAVRRQGVPRQIPTDPWFVLDYFEPAGDFDR